MFRLVALLVLAVAYVSAAPGALLASYAAPVAPAVVTAQSSQVIARNYNGLAAPLLAAPVAAAVAAPLHTAPLVPATAAYTSGYFAPTAYAAAPAYYL